jgi:hypothetical protein
VLLGGGGGDTGSTAVDRTNRCALTSVRDPKGVTPLILAAQKGNVKVLCKLLTLGANVAECSSNGSTALLQAAHFGHRDIVQTILTWTNNNPHSSSILASSLVEMPNSNMTTPLMRAAQEGHVGIVDDLLRVGANPNRINHGRMAALTLASQRGHVKVCQSLIKAGADLDARTHQDSTSLLLACKRGHVNVVRLLVSSGCELWIKDSRGRTARDVLRRRYDSLQSSQPNRASVYKSVLGYLDSNVQRYLMRCEARKTRSRDMMLYWKLLQDNRAVPAMPHNNVSLATVLATDPHTLPYPFGLVSTQALLRTMRLPAALVELIASFLPLPPLWEQLVNMLMRRADINPNETVVCCLDLIDEILEEGGWVQACQAANVPPPHPYTSWTAWKTYGQTIPRHLPSSMQTPPYVHTNLTLRTLPSVDRPSIAEHRRAAGFLPLLAKHSRLVDVFKQPPFEMSPLLLNQLTQSQDVASLVRRVGSNGSGGIHFDSVGATDFVGLVSRLSGWYWSYSQKLLVPRTPAGTESLIETSIAVTAMQ